MKLLRIVADKYQDSMVDRIEREFFNTFLRQADIISDFPHNKESELRFISATPRASKAKFVIRIDRLFPGIVGQFKTTLRGGITPDYLVQLPRIHAHLLEQFLVHDLGYSPKQFTKRKWGNNFVLFGVSFKPPVVKAINKFLKAKVPPKGSGTSYYLVPNKDRTLETPTGYKMGKEERAIVDKAIIEPILKNPIFTKVVMNKDTRKSKPVNYVVDQQQLTIHVDLSKGTNQ